MRRSGREIAKRKQPVLVGVWIEFGLHFGVRRILAPLKKIIDGPLRPIAIPDDERELFLGELFLHGFKGARRRLADDTFRGEITADRPAHEVMGARIADVLDNGWVYVAQINKTLG